MEVIKGDSPGASAMYDFLNPLFGVNDLRPGFEVAGFSFDRGVDGKTPAGLP